MNNYLFVFTCLLLTACQSMPSSVENTSTTLEQRIDNLLATHNFNGVVLLTERKDTLYYKARGMADVEGKQPLKKDDQFVIGSISKQITAVLILKAYEEGRLGLNHSLDKYLSNIKAEWAKAVTIEHLLTHTHGIIDLKQPLAFELGSQFQYSQLGYELLARVLEKIYEKSFEEIAMLFFKDNGFLHSFHPKSKGYQLVNGYEEVEGKLVYSKSSLENYAAAGSFISNTTDLHRWNRHLHEGKLIYMSSLERMKAKYATRIHPIFGEVDYGYGLLFQEGEQNIQIGALGYAPGFVSSSYYYPNTKRNLVVLSNTARQLEDFHVTFKIHTSLMELAKNLKPLN